MNTDEIIQLARKHLGSGAAEDRARICLSGAIECNQVGDLGNAKFLALQSLAYRVGIHHPDYRKAIGYRRALQAHRKALQAR